MYRIEKINCCGKECGKPVGSVDIPERTHRNSFVAQRTCANRCIGFSPPTPRLQVQLKTEQFFQNGCIELESQIFLE